VARKHHRPWSPSAEDRSAAAALGPGAAFVPLDGGFGYVRGTVLDLVQAVYEACPGRAHTVLRRRIRTTSPVTALDRAVADVAAKRVAEVAPAGDGAIVGTDLAPWIAVARARGARAVFVPEAADAPDVRPSREVLAVLVDPDGRPRLAARNAAETNRTLHAELNLVQAWGRIPAGWRIRTSLQPCRMCAAVIVGAAEGPIRVEYLEPDPGRLATRTLLQALGWEAPVG
jgi:tRNA(Arg) A34 adenosine deaminase TadA